MQPNRVYYVHWRCQANGRMPCRQGRPDYIRQRDRLQGCGFWYVLRAMDYASRMLKYNAAYDEGWGLQLRWMALIHTATLDWLRLWGEDYKPGTQK